MANPFTANQAPAAMQMIAPDLAAQQMQLSRQQKIADMLREQSMTPMGDTQTIGGWAIKKSPLEGLAKLAQALGANYSQSQTDENQLALSKSYQGRLADAINGKASADVAAPMAMGAGATAQPSTPDASGEMVNQGGVGPTLGNALRMDSMTKAPSATPDNFNMGNMMRGQAIDAIGGESAGRAFWDNLKSTEGMKTDKYLGITPDQSRTSELAKRLKEGTQSLQSNQTNIYPDGSMFVAPNFETGVAGGFDAQKKPFATEVSGSSEIAANRSRLIKQAEAGVADNFAVPAKVDAASGPVALTPAQQRAQAHGGVDPARPKNPMTPQPGDSDRAMIYQGEMRQAKERLAAAKTPEETMRAKDDIESLKRETSRIGIKLQDDSSRKFGEQVASSSATSLLEGRDKAKAASDSLVGIQKSRSAIGGGVFQGSGAETKLAIAKFVNANIPGVNIDAEKVTNTDYLKSTLGAGLLAEAKTLGTNPSNADATRINDIVGSLSKDPQAMKKILDWRQEMAERSIKNHNATVGDAESRGMSSPYELRVNSPAPAAEPTAPAPASSAKTFSSLPNPAEFSGKRMRAPDGSVIRSNGKTWTKE